MVFRLPAHHVHLAYSMQVIERDLNGIPQDEREKIIRGNVAKLYGFDL